MKGAGANYSALGIKAFETNDMDAVNVLNLFCLLVCK